MSVKKFMYHDEQYYPWMSEIGEDGIETDPARTGVYVLLCDYESARAGTHKTALQAKESIDEMKASLDAAVEQRDEFKDAWRAAGNVAQKQVRLAADLRKELSTVTAQKEALEKELAEEQRAHMQTIGERDDAEEALGNAYAWVTDNPAEWSNCFSYTDATNEIAEVMQRLRAKKSTFCDCTEPGQCIGQPPKVSCRSDNSEPYAKPLEAPHEAK
jgi:hypothetical protein